MKRNLFFLFFTICFFSINPLEALHYTTPENSYLHLAEINKEWEKHSNSAPEKIIFFKSDADRIQYHLQMVEAHLRKNVPANISSAAKENRFLLLDKLKDYAAKKRFPTNSYHAERTPYFIDDFGVYCAVGFLIKESGNKDLAQKINNEHRYDYINNIKTKGLVEWAQKFGFTADELAWIQPNYQAETIFNPVQNGVNGNINKFKQSDGNLFFIGDFDSVNNLPCLKIGQYYDGQLSCLGNGLNGTINDIFPNYDGTHVVAGAFQKGDSIFPIAHYNGKSWNFIAIPGIKKAIGNTIYKGGNHIEVVITNPENLGYQEIWNENYDKTWQRIASIKGIVNAIEASSYGRIYAGAFSEVIVPRKNYPDIILKVNNVVFNTNYSDEWFGAGEEISDTVKVIKNLYGTIYFGGVCSDKPGRSKVCLSRFVNYDLQPLILRKSFSDKNDCAVYDIAHYNNTDVVVAGKFILPNVDLGINLLKYELLSNNMESLGGLNEKVTGISKIGNKWYIAGDFTNNFGIGDLKHIATFSDPTSISKNSDIKNSISPYPNPAQNALNINLQNFNFSHLEVYDLLGKNVFTANINSNKDIFTLDISTYKNGLYIMKLAGKDGETIARKFEVLK